MKGELHPTKNRLRGGLEYGRQLNELIYFPVRREGGYSFVACHSNLTIDHAYLSGRSWGVSEGGGDRTECKPVMFGNVALNNEVAGMLLAYGGLRWLGWKTRVVPSPCERWSHFLLACTEGT